MKIANDRFTEKGSISITAAIFGAALFGLLLALISHGQFTNSYTRTREAASNAARTGTQEIDISHYLSTGENRIDIVKAEQAVRDHIDTYPDLSIGDLDITTTEIEVTVNETITSISGVTKTITSKGTATPLQDR